jgi:transcriptional regulator with XRE-family HTH domain
MDLSGRLRMAVALRREPRTTVAKRLGIARSTLVNWCNGLTAPTVEQVRSLAQLLNVSDSWLAFGSGDMLVESAEPTPARQVLNTVPTPPTSSAARAA